MSNSNGLHVVIGASGGIGNALVRELVKCGKRVRAVNRTGHADVPASVEMVTGDALDPASMRAVCQGASVVYNCVNVPYPQWATQFPPMMQAITAAATVANAKLIFADNLYMYGPVAGPITEDLPYAARGHKGQLRARMANELMAAHKSGAVRAAIGRASDFYGPNSNSLGGDFVMRPLLAGKKAMWVGNLDMPHTLTYLSDFARGLVTLGERDEALGQVWHIPGAEPLTGRQYLQMVFDEAGLPPKIGVHSPWMVRFVGLFSPMVREVTETLYQFERPFVVDGRKFARAFGNAPATPHREAIKQMVAWYRQHDR